MANSFKLSIVTPEGQVYEDRVESVVAPGECGSFGVLAFHAPMVAALEEGVLSLTSHGAHVYFALGAGLAEVSEGNVMILADRADRADSSEEAKRMLKEKGA